MLGDSETEALRVCDISAEREGQVHRVSADVAGETLWFESPDVELVPSPEAFGCALLMAALHDGRPLAIEGSVSTRWLSNADRLLEIIHGWWGYPRLSPRVASRADDDQPKVHKTALCFSGGVDSFYSLLHSGERIDSLLAVHGYDIELGDETRALKFDSSLRAVAAAHAVRPVLVRTNLREHSAFARASWEHTHGGALAAVGHLLGGSAGRLLVSSSYPYGNHVPWGSHWQTDPLWSSDRLEMIHVGAEHQRSQKLKAIASEPLVRRHLRVCWENLSPEGNCSRCEKCLRTRLVLADLGELENFSVFEGLGTLAGHLDSLPAIPGRGRVFARMLERGRLPPEVKTALRNLTKRTRRSKGSTSRLRRNMLGRAFAWAQSRIQ